MANNAYATQEDLNRINEYFKDSGVQYEYTDKILVFNTVLDIGIHLYLYETHPIALLKFLNEHKPDGDNFDSLLEQVVNEQTNVWNDYENGKIYLITE